MAIVDSYRNLSIKKKLLISLVIVVAVFGVFAFFVLRSLVILGINSTAVNEHYTELNALYRLEIQNRRLSDLAKAFILTGDPRWESAYDEASVIFDEALSAVKQPPVDPARQSMIDQFEEITTNLKGTELLIIASVKEGNTEKATQLFDRNYEQRQNEASQLLSRLLEDLLTELSTHMSENERTLVGLRRIFTLFTALALTVILVVLVGGAVFISRPIINLNAVVERLAGGDLAARASVFADDELGHVARMLNQMAERLQTSHVRLQEEVAKKTQELAEKVTSLGETKGAMLNLLEDEKVLEAELREERDRGRAILNSMGEGLVVVDQRSRVITMNPAAERLLGETFMTLQGRNWGEIVRVLEADRELSLPECPVTKALTKGETVVVTIDDNHSYQTQAGKKFPVAAVTAPLRGDGITGAVIVFRDVSSGRAIKEEIERTVLERTHELRQARNKISEGWFQLQQEKARLASSIQSLPLGFILTDVAGSIIMMNQAAQRILGLSAPAPTLDDIGQPLGDAYNLRTLHAECSQTKQVVEKRELVVGGRYLKLVIGPILLKEKENACIGTAMLLDDITEAKALERSRDEFFSIASHELRTPLTAIRGNTSMLQDYFGKEISDQSAREMLVDVHDASVRLITIVNDFLDVSRLELRKMQFHVEPFDLSLLAVSVVEEYQAAVRERGLVLTLTASPGLPQVIADKDRVRQVLTNLLDNALKFTQTGTITVATAVSDGSVELSVSDTGMGIEPRNQAFLFRKFQQAGDSPFTRDVTEGTGLGLYISALLLTQMGGSIRLVSSTPGKGSTFAFRLPINTL